MTVGSDHAESLARSARSDFGASEFWKSSGFLLLDRRPDGRLSVTDDFLRAYLTRPELQLVEDSCMAERTLHRILAATPAAAVAPEEIAAIADDAARDNFSAYLRFRDLLLGQDSLEDSYIRLLRERVTGIAPLFIDQMVHAMLRGLLSGCRDPFQLRAAELLFRIQSVSIANGTIMVADEETVELQSAHLAAPQQQAEVELDVLGEATAEGYWTRSDRFDMALDISFTRPGLDALCRVLEAWVRHFLDIAVSVHPVQKIRDDRWVWHIGLDAEASSILNRLYGGDPVSEVETERILSLFRLDFADPADMREDVAGRPVYLAMAMDERNRLRLKPQNLLMNLPLASQP